MWGAMSKDRYIPGMRRTSRIDITTKWREGRPIVFAGIAERVLQRDVHDGHLTVIVGQEPQGWHLSISHRTNEVRPRPKRYPSWDEIADARYRFVPDHVTMAMLLPPKEEYVNLHETTFHLHEIAKPEAGGSSGN